MTVYRKLWLNVALFFFAIFGGISVHSGTKNGPDTVPMLIFAAVAACVALALIWSTPSEE